MTRVKRRRQAQQKRAKLLKLNRGFGAGHGNLFRQAHQQRLKAYQASFTGRKEFQREQRRLWIQRIQGGLQDLAICDTHDVGMQERFGTILLSRTAGPSSSVKPEDCVTFLYCAFCQSFICLPLIYFFAAETTPWVSFCSTMAHLTDDPFSSKRQILLRPGTNAHVQSHFLRNTSTTWTVDGNQPQPATTRPWVPPASEMTSVLTYQSFIHFLKVNNIDLNRKVLSQLSIFQYQFIHSLRLAYVGYEGTWNRLWSQRPGKLQ